jgi:minimal PKS chain-length factor (CLF/KS beta)
VSTPVVVTGIGVTAPNGVGLDRYWDAALAGESGIRRITQFDPQSYPVRYAGEVRDFDASDHIPAKLRAQTDHMTHLAVHATDLALGDAGIDPASENEYEMAVITANSSGGIIFGQRELQKLWSKGPLHVSAYMSVAWFYAATTGQISIRYGMRGPCGVLASEQAGGLDAIGHARRVIRHGTGLAVTGGTDASLSPAGLSAQIATGLLSQRDDPDRAFVPFDVDACGFVPGHGGAIMILESAARALERGAPRIYGEIAGYGATFDPRAGRSNLHRAAELALADADRDAAEVDVVFADANGNPELDRVEAEAITNVFGGRRVAVTAPKTMTGRLYAGGAALDVATALLSIRDGVIPPTINVGRLAAGCDIDLVRGRPRHARIECALVLARGYGGFNSAAVISASS